ncbi:MAG: hypothetical protein GXO21_03280 [Aquificae bacterium]|nr:hypothetical protein [Aquificota bacterium]
MGCLENKKLRKLGVSKENVKENLKKQIVNFLQLGWRSRQIKIGFDDSIKEIRKGKKGFLIVAEDIAERTKRNILREHKGEYFQIFKKAEIGHFLGRGEVGIIFVPETKFGLKLKNLLKQYLQLDTRR